MTFKLQDSGEKKFGKYVFVNVNQLINLKITAYFHVMSQRHAFSHQVVAMLQQLGRLFFKEKFSKCNVHNTPHVRKP